MKLKFGKTELSVSFTLLCLAAVSVILGVFRSFVWCAAAITVHECGHLVMMIRYGYFPERIKISLFEIAISDSGRERRCTKENVFIIFFGPFVNFICFLAGYLLYLKGISFILPFAAANLSVGLFNLLPVMSLDGGQLLYLLLLRFFSPDRAEKAVDLMTFLFIFPLAALGFLVLLKSKHNVSLLFVSVYLMFSLMFKGNRYY